MAGARLRDGEEGVEVCDQSTTAKKGHLLTKTILRLSQYVPDDADLKQRALKIGERYRKRQGIKLKDAVDLEEDDEQDEEVDEGADNSDGVSDDDKPDGADEQLRKGKKRQREPEEHDENESGDGDDVIEPQDLDTPTKTAGLARSDSSRGLSKASPCKVEENNPHQPKTPQYWIWELNFERAFHGSNLGTPIYQAQLLARSKKQLTTADVMALSLRISQAQDAVAINCLNCNNIKDDGELADKYMSLMQAGAQPTFKLKMALYRRSMGTQWAAIDKMLDPGELRTALQRVCRLGLFWNAEGTLAEETCN